MLARSCTLRWVLLLGCLVILAACGGDDDDDDDGGETPTEAGVAITATPTSEPPTPTDEATDAPEPTETSTSEPSPTATDEPTTSVPQPRPSSTPIIINTPTPMPSLDPSGLSIPADLRDILPLPEEIPGGMNLTTTTDEGGTIETVAEQAPDPAEYDQLLQDAGFQNAARRVLELPADAPLDESTQIIAMNSVAILLGSNDGAFNEVNYHRDVIMLPDPEFGLAPVEIEPVGDYSTAATGATDIEGFGVNIAVVWSQVGPLSLRSTVLSAGAHDPLPDAIAAVQVSLGLLGYTSAGTPPTEGEVLVATDFSDWIVQEFDSGTISFVDGTYRLNVTQGGGSFVSAYTEENVFTDFSVSVDLRMTTDTPSATGCVIARLQPVDLNHDYALCLDGGGGVTAIYEQFDAEGGYASEPILQGDFGLAGSAQEWNRLRIIARGGDFWFFVNDELIGSASHAGPAEGHAGIVVNNYGETPTEFEFTNFVVRALE